MTSHGLFRGCRQGVFGAGDGIWAHFKVSLSNRDRSPAEEVARRTSGTGEGDAGVAASAVDQTLPTAGEGPTYLGFLGLPRTLSTTLNLYLRVISEEYQKPFSASQLSLYTLEM